MVRTDQVLGICYRLFSESFTSEAQDPNLQERGKFLEGRKERRNWRSRICHDYRDPADYLSPKGALNGPAFSL